MNKYSIRTRLITAFSFFIAVILSIILQAVSGFQQSRERVGNLYNNELVASKLVNDIAFLHSRNRVIVMDAATLANEENTQKRKTELIKNLAKIETLWQEYKAIEHTPEEAELVVQYEVAVAPYIKGVNSMFTALESFAEQEEITTVYVNEISKTSPEPMRILARLSDIQAEVAEASFKNAIERTGTAINFGFLYGAVALTICIVATVVLTRSIVGPIKSAGNLASTIASGDLTSNIVNSGRDELSGLLTSLEQMQASLRSVVGNVRQGAEGVSTASSEIASGNHDLSARTESQASALQETAASMEQLSSTVRQNADSAQTASQQAGNAAHLATAGGKIVTEVADTMNGINESSKKITEIISVIEGIAFQTNILALNAAVEAARAGEQGRGFAVVASEVRSLAGRSADAAKQIKKLIEESVLQVTEGVHLTTKAGLQMMEVVTSINSVASLVSEISSASREQAEGVSQVGEAVTQMDQVTQQNAALVEEMAAAASSLKQQAEELVNEVQIFKV